MVENSVARENLITRINYSESAIGLFQLAFLVPAWGFTYLFEHDPHTKLPPLLFGHIHDVTFPPVYASVSRTMPEYVWKCTSNQNMLRGFAFASTIEIGQFAGFAPGTFDPLDFVSYGIGAVAWRAWDETAKGLYNLKVRNRYITSPVYKALGIQDKRV
ncbi:hypothetical protein HY085_02285 [Candidatus Gottesmanbacteria bacterium]|nr:hypothetical protein [Candidatus Gottesmanbacteria bacterium]